MLGVANHSKIGAAYDSFQKFWSRKKTWIGCLMCSVHALYTSHMFIYLVHSQMGRGID
jgi:hypothetical protein